MRWLIPFMPLLVLVLILLQEGLDKDDENCFLERDVYS